MKHAAAALAPVLALAVFAVPCSAARLTTGKSVIWVGLNGNRSQLVDPTSGINQTFEGQELGLHLAYSYFISGAWSLVGSWGFDVGHDENKLPDGDKLKFTSNSWNLRVGADRYAFINDDVAVYAGPGLMYWRGHGEFDGSHDPEVDREWPTVRQLAFNGRMGMYARFAQHYGLFGHIGQVIAGNNAKDGNGRNTWWTSHHEGSVGIAVDL